MRVKKTDGRSLTTQRRQMYLSKPDAGRVDLGVRRYKQAARKSPFTAAARCRGPRVRLFLLHAHRLPIRVLEDLLRHVPDLQTTVVVVHRCKQSNRGWQTSPQCANHNEYVDPVFVTGQNLVEISAVMLVLLYRRLEMHMMHRRTIMRKHDVIHKTRST